MFGVSDATAWCCRLQIDLDAHWCTHVIGWAAIGAAIDRETHRNRMRAYGRLRWMGFLAPALLLLRAIGCILTTQLLPARSFSLTSLPSRRSVLSAPSSSIRAQLLLLPNTRCIANTLPRTTASLPRSEPRRIGTAPRRFMRETVLLSSSAIAGGGGSAAAFGTFLVRIVFLRALALVHAVAFLVALRQNRGLIGDRGICPARNVLNDAQERGRIKKERRLLWRSQGLDQGNIYGDDDRSWYLSNALRRMVLNVKRSLGQAVDSNPRWLKAREVLWDRSDGMDRPVTSILWLAKDRTNLNPWLDAIALAGLSVSLLVMATGAANVPLMLVLWVCQRSLMAVGGPFYGFGWEPQLAELSFHTLFLVPLLSLDPIPVGFPIPPAVRWTVQWYLFRIMMGAGLIKLKSGDRKWKDLSAMDYFYETQPVPNPLTRYFHWMPRWWHKFEVLANHAVELLAPWLLILPGLSKNWRRAGGLIQLSFQSILIASGNLSFLNWLTAVPAIMCLDDELLRPLFPVNTVFKAQLATYTISIAPALGPSAARQVVSLAFLAAIAGLSIPVVMNLISKRQVMNGSFDKLRLVNTYGAFGTINTDRDEFIIIAAPSIDGPWREYRFKVKPGDPQQPPKWISPYHYRLDWQMWIAATCRSIDRSPWLYRLMIKLLEREPDVLALMEEDPWAAEANAGNQSQLPKYIRVDQFRFNFHRPQPGEEKPSYWDRELQARVYPRRGQGVATVESLKDEIKRRA
jgi:lipase maturation factor 1